jgi:hypothetical protein
MFSPSPKKGHWMLFFTEKIAQDNIKQNLVNLRINYARRFLRLSLWLICNYTVHLFGKLVKRKLQEVMLDLVRSI